MHVLHHKRGERETASLRDRSYLSVCSHPASFLSDELTLELGEFIVGALLSNAARCAPRWRAAALLALPRRVALAQVDNKGRFNQLCPYRRPAVGAVTHAVFRTEGGKKKLVTSAFAAADIPPFYFGAQWRPEWRKDRAHAMHDQPQDALPLCV